MTFVNSTSGLLCRCIRTHVWTRMFWKQSEGNDQATFYCVYFSLINILRVSTSHDHERSERTHDWANKKSNTCKLRNTNLSKILLNIDVQLTSHRLCITVSFYLYQGSLNHIDYPPNLHVTQDGKILKVPPVTKLPNYGPPVVIHTRGGETHINLWCFAWHKLFSLL